MYSRPSTSHSRAFSARSVKTGVAVATRYGSVATGEEVSVGRHGVSVALGEDVRVLSSKAAGQSMATVLRPNTSAEILISGPYT
jgi:hypothetical protein